MRTYWMFYFYSLKKKRSIDGLREVQEPSKHLCKTCVCSFVEQIHPFWKLSEDLRRQKNMSSQCEQSTVHKYPMDTDTLSYTSPGCSVLSCPADNYITLNSELREGWPRKTSLIQTLRFTKLLFPRCIYFTQVLQKRSLFINYNQPQFCSQLQIKSYRESFLCSD